jgi:hypothetical protein
VLAAIFFLDAIFYYRASCFAPWKRQPGVEFHVLPVEVRVKLANLVQSQIKHENHCSKHVSRSHARIKLAVG